MGRKLNTMQQAFVDAYDGNATQAALTAGYSKKTAHSQGGRLLKHVVIADAIRNREKLRSDALIANREERQRLWTKVLRGELLTKTLVGPANNKTVEELPPSIVERLKAAELLGRSEADFIDTNRNEFPEGLPGLVIEGKSPDKGKVKGRGEPVDVLTVNPKVVGIKPGGE